MRIKYERIIHDFKVIEQEADESEFVERRSANGFLFDASGRLLVYESLNRRLYDIPGGGIDEGETAEEAVRREFLEESGLLVEVGRKIGEATQYFSYWTAPPFRNTRQYFLVRRVGGELLENGNGVDSFKSDWKRLDELTRQNTGSWLMDMLPKLNEALAKV